MSSRDLFSKPQYTSFVIVLVGFIQCQQAHTLSGLQHDVAEEVSLSGFSRFFARSPWDTEALAARWQERFRRQMTPVVQAELALQQEVRHPRKVARWKASGSITAPPTSGECAGIAWCKDSTCEASRRCPLPPRLYRQQHVCEREEAPFQSKIDLMIELIQCFEPVAGTLTHVLLDSWYSAKAIWQSCSRTRLPHHHGAQVQSQPAYRG